MKLLIISLLIILLLIFLIYNKSFCKEGLTLEGENSGVSHSGWQDLAECCVSRISITPDGKQIWALGTGSAANEMFWTWTKSGVGTWNVAHNSCCVVSICFGPDNKLYGVGTDGQVWQYDGKWHPHTIGWVRFITIVGEWIYGIGSSYGTYRIPLNSKYGTEWQQLTPAGVYNIAVDPTENLIYGVGSDLAVYRARIHSGSVSPWQKVTTGDVKQIKLYEDKIFAVGADNNLYVHEKNGNGSWIKFDDQPNDGITWIEIKNNYIYAIKTDNTVIKRQIFNEAPNPVLGSGKWSSPLPSPGSVIMSASDDKLPNLNGNWTDTARNLFTIVQTGNKIVANPNNGIGEIVGNKINLKWTSDGPNIIGTFLNNKGAVNIINWQKEGTPVTTVWTRNSVPDFNGVWNDGVRDINVTQSGSIFKTSYYPNWGIGTGNIDWLRGVINFTWSDFPGLLIQGGWNHVGEFPTQIGWNAGGSVWHKK